MITSLLELTLTPAAVADEERTRHLLKSTLEVTRAFPGCLEVEVLLDMTNPQHIVVRECWQSVGHDDAYRAWRKTPAGASQIALVLAEPPRMTRFRSAGHS